jgi:hypothetical protein
MAGPRKFEPGQSALDFTLDDYRYLVAGVKGLVKPPAVAPLEWADDSLHLATVDGFWAKLSGAANPYGMAEQYGVAGGAFASRVRTCTGCAYEVNGQAKLNGKMIWLEPGAPGEYVGQWIGEGSGGVVISTCCSGISLPRTISLTANSGSSSGFVSATLTYGPAPSTTTAGSTGVTCSPGWWSGPLTSPGNGSYPIYYNLCPCFGLITLFGGPGLAGTIAYTDDGNPTYIFQNRVCSPLLLSGGTQEIGGPGNSPFDFANFTASG